MYKIKNSKELASLINCINLNNMISEEEMEEYLDKVGEQQDYAGYLNKMDIVLLHLNLKIWH